MITRHPGLRIVRRPTCVETMRIMLANLNYRTLGLAALAATLLTTVPVPGAAQVGVGWNVGGSSLGELNPDSQEAVQLSPDAGILLGAHVDRWYGASEHVGVRFAGAWQRPRFNWVQGERIIDAVSGDLSILIRPRAPGGDEGVELLPYLAVGAGGVWYDLGRGEGTSFPAADSFHDGKTGITPVLLFGGGVDVGLPLQWFGNPLRVRLEVADHYALQSPFRNLATGDRHGAVHNLRFTVGAYSVVDFAR